MLVRHLYDAGITNKIDLLDARQAPALSDSDFIIDVQTSKRIQLLLYISGTCLKQNQEMLLVYFLFGASIFFTFDVGKAFSAFGEEVFVFCILFLRLHDSGWD